MTKLPCGLSSTLGTGSTSLQGMFFELHQLPACQHACLLSRRVQHPRLNAALQLVREAVQHLGIRPYDEASGRGELRYLQLTAAGSETSGWMAQQDSQASVQVLLEGLDLMSDDTILLCCHALLSWILFSSPVPVPPASITQLAKRIMPTCYNRQCSWADALSRYPEGTRKCGP